MPFFTENKYLSAPSQVWIWTTVTVVCTAIAFAGYMYVVRRQKQPDDPEIGNKLPKFTEKGTESVGS